MGRTNRRILHNWVNTEVAAQVAESGVADAHIDSILGRKVYRRHWVRLGVEMFQSMANIRDSIGSVDTVCLVIDLQEISQKSLDSLTLATITKYLDWTPPELRWISPKSLEKYTHFWDEHGRNSSVILSGVHDFRSVNIDWLRPDGVRVCTAWLISGR